MDSQLPVDITKVLPPELQLQIFSYLGWESHIMCARTCTLWRDLIQTYGHAFPRNDYSDETYPGIHTLLNSYEAQLFIYNEELVSVSIHEIIGAEFSRFGLMGEYICTLDPRKDYLLNHPVFKFAEKPPEGVGTFDGFVYGAETPDNWESAIERFGKNPGSSETTIRQMYGRLVAMLLRQSEATKWKLMKIRVRHVMTSGELAVFWGKFTRGVGEVELMSSDTQKP
ncbi:hypothetical protein TWF569_011873 [Orbilia oligospora]|uniref:F-box domain-containing protein n=1 Tax=Orbilia oligospora TaxID=2813651 RepID=A0A7C8N0X4_ORBOL|nr:hypothetical protein TWF102_000495 [Orbilia oligospora]KAF3097110.1 hypothetical protein TWF103_009636 [Orbilia oligospora]KAF3117090.1 hypothetical protein TWF706_000291 [Orbilia oligospora]KAF3127060.1 hypothetical protein TWF569_011873 [Orbilia oligospora]KAF3136645.1 hypothetical protein TWF703_005359 [Orbilia oligospora]